MQLTSLTLQIVRQMHGEFHICSTQLSVYLRPHRLHNETMPNTFPFPLSVARCGAPAPADSQFPQQLLSIADGLELHSSKK